MQSSNFEDEKNDRINSNISIPFKSKTAKVIPSEKVKLISDKQYRSVRVGTARTPLV